MAKREQGQINDTCCIRVEDIIKQKLWGDVAYHHATDHRREGKKDRERDKREGKETETEEGFRNGLS